MNEKICTICLRTTLNILPLLEDDYLKAALDNLLLESILNTPQQQNVCNECRENLQVFYDFKRTCVRRKEVADHRSDVDLYQEEFENKQKSVIKDLMTCWFCGKIVVKLCFVSVTELKKSTSLVNVLEKYLPEMSLRDTEQMAFCESCHNSLQGLLSFLTNCFDVEQKRRKYTEVERTDVNSKIDLKPLQEFTYNPTLQQEIGCCSAVKLEATDGNQEQFALIPKPELKCTNEDDLEPIIDREVVYIKSEQDESEDFQDILPEATTDYGEQDLSQYETYSFSTSDDIYDLKNPSELTIFKCESCAFETECENDIKRHMMIHENFAETTMFKCNFCTYDTRSERIMRVHVSTHKTTSEKKRYKKMYKCKDCAYETINKTSMAHHMVVHTDPSDITMYKCEVCTFQTKHRLNMKRHILIHTDPSERKSYKCSDCAFETIYTASMRRHMETHKDPSERKVVILKDPLNIIMHKCELCIYETKRSRDLKRHMLTHKDPPEGRKYKCTECSYETVTKFQMRRHKMTHRDSSKCEICPFETRYSKNMTRHMLTHKDPSEIQKYNCKYCEYEAMSKISMEQHMVSHKDSLGKTVLMCECVMCI